MFKVNKNIKRRQQRRFCVSVVDFDQINVNFGESFVNLSGTCRQYHSLSLSQKIEFFNLLECFVLHWQNIEKHWFWLVGVRKNNTSQLERGIFGEVFAFRGRLIERVNPSRHLPAQSQQKHQNKVGNMFKVTNKDTKTTPLASFWYLYC